MFVTGRAHVQQHVFNGFQLLHSLIRMRWITEILYSINVGNTRYNQILGSIEGMSHTELNRKLALLLERDVIVKETSGGEIHYQLCDFGEELIHIFNHLAELEQRYLPSQAV